MKYIYEAIFLVFVIIITILSSVFYNYINNINHQEKIVSKSNYYKNKTISESQEDVSMIWGGYKFEQNFDPKIKVVKTKIETGEKTNVVVLSESQDNYVYEMKIYKDSLYIVISEYLRPSYLFFLENPDSEAIDITPEGSMPNSLLETKNHFFMLSSFGDECTYLSDYYLLSEKNVFKKVISSDAGCEPATEVIGVFENKFILSDHDYKVNPQENTLFMNNQKYLNLYTVDINDNSKKEFLLKSLPEVDYIFFNEEATLNLSGESEWTFDLKTRTLTLVK